MSCGCGGGCAKGRVGGTSTSSSGSDPYGMVPWLLGLLVSVALFSGRRR